MATKTFDELKQLAIQIRDEKTNKQNTANRVGTAMLEGINKLEQDYYDKTAADKELKKRDDKLIELETVPLNDLISNQQTLNLNIGEKDELFILSVLSNRYINKDGVISETSASLWCSDYIQLDDGYIYMIEALGGNSNNPSLVLYDKNKKAIGLYYLSTLTINGESLNAKPFILIKMGKAEYAAFNLRSSDSSAVKKYNFKHYCPVKNGNWSLK